MAESTRRGSTLGGIVKDQSAESFRMIVADYLLRAGHITRGQQEEAAKWLRNNPQRLVTEFLLKKNYIESATVTTVLSRQYNFPAVNLAEKETPPEALSLMPYELAKKYMAVPYNKRDNKLYLAMVEPTNNKALEELSNQLRHQIMPGVDSFQSVVDAFQRLYSISDTEYQSFLAPLDPKDAADQDQGPGKLSMDTHSIVCSYVFASFFAYIQRLV